ncbi:MAG: HemK2/MTQ2 family protein methyltransferase [Candidatus Helarchaeota archaeon]
MKGFFKTFLMYGSIISLKILNSLIHAPLITRIDDKFICFAPDVFNPMPFIGSSKLFYHHLAIPRSSKVLDMGTGSGILAIFAAEKAHSVLASDLNPKALRVAKINIKMNKLAHKIQLRKGNLFNTIPEKFNVILFNPPYFPVKPKTYLDLAWCGGRRYEFLRKFLRKARYHLTSGGFIQISLSSLMHLKFIHKLIDATNYRRILIGRKVLFFEILYLYILIPQNRGQ